MSLEYIAETYRVPAKEGGRVRYTGGRVQKTGTIIGSASADLRIKMDDGEVALYHPTWKMEYLPEDETPPVIEPAPAMQVVPAETIRRAIDALELYASNTLAGTHSAGELRMLLSAAPAVQGEPALVAWVLFDATADQKYIKMNDRDGSLAFFDNEAAAQRAKHLAPGTDYKRCEYYTAPQPAEQQPAPDVSALVGALEAACDYLSIGSHALEQVRAALSAHRKQGGE